MTPGPALDDPARGACDDDLEAAQPAVPVREEPFDCIFLKNVLIYFDVESKKTVIRNLLPLLAKGGFLVAGLHR